MPTVPTTFVPQVAPQQRGDIGEFAAPGVQPAENLAGQQLAQYGQQLTQTGMAAYRLGSSIQDGIDDARTKDADIRASRDMQAISNEYSAMIGVDAQNNYASMQDKLDQASQSAMDSLENDVQRRMLAPILSRNKGLFQSRMWQHHAEQVRVYGTKAALGRAQQQSDLAVEAYKQRNMEVNAKAVGLVPYLAYVETAMSETRKAGKLMGYADDSPQMQLLEQELVDGIAVGVVNNLMLTKEYADATLFLEDEASVDQISSTTRHKLMDSVVANRKRSLIDELSESIMIFGQLLSYSDPKNYPTIGTDDAQHVRKWPKPQTLREALDIADHIPDAELNKYVKAELRTRYAQDAALVEQEYRTLINGVEQFLARPENNIGTLESNVFAQLRPVDQERYLTNEMRTNDLRVELELAENPALIADDKWLQANRWRITSQKYAELLEQRNKPDRIASATVDADQLTTTLINAGFADIATPDPKNKTEQQQALLFREAVKAKIDIEQTRLQRPLSRVEKQQIIDQQIIDKVWISSWWRDPEKPMAFLTPEEMAQAYVVVDKDEIMLTDIPKIRIAEIRKQLIRENVIPTMQDIAEAWVKAGKPK